MLASLELWLDSKTWLFGGQAAQSTGGLALASWSNGNRCMSKVTRLLITKAGQAVRGLARVGITIKFSPISI